MSTLSGTVWVAELGGLGKQWWQFKDDGTVEMVDPPSHGGNGSASVGYYAESADGGFIIQSPNSTNNPNINGNIFGSFANDKGSGYWIDGTSPQGSLFPFTMTLDTDPKS